MNRKALSVVSDAEPIPASVAPRAVGPDAARALVAQRIAEKDQRAADIASNTAKMERAREVLFQGSGDEDAATKVLNGAKARSLMEGDSRWRESRAVVTAQTDLQDAQERMTLARTVVDELKEERANLDRAAEWDDSRIREAVSEVVRTSPSVRALIAEAIEKRRAWRETELALNVIASHFPQFGVPGWDSTKVFDIPPTRDREWRDAIARLHVDADVAFPV